MSHSQDTLHRQWQMLRLIPRYPRKITGRSLVEQLETYGFVTTKRTVERDLQSLSLTFPLVVDTRSLPYGWSWQQGAAALDVPALNPTEALSFMMVKQFLEPLMPTSLLDQLAPYFGMAEQCLSSHGGGTAAGNWLKKIAVTPAGQPLLPAHIQTDVQSVLQEALLHNRQVRLRYQRRGERAEVEYIVHPLGLVQRGGVFYLVATFFDYEDIRLLVLHRMRSAELLDEEARQRKDFSLQSYIAAGHFGFVRETSVDLVLRFSHEAGEHLWDTRLAEDQIITETADGHLEVRATVVDNLQLRWWLLGFAEGVEVVAPASLRELLGERLRLAASAYVSEVR